MCLDDMDGAVGVGTSGDTTPGPSDARKYPSSARLNPKIQPGASPAAAMTSSPAPRRALAGCCGAAGSHSNGQAKLGLLASGKLVLTSSRRWAYPCAAARARPSPPPLC